MMLAFATAAAFAAQLVQLPGQAQARALEAEFDLARSAPGQYAAPPVPIAPRNLDTRDFAVDAPEIEFALVDNGPVIRVGAMGGRHKGVPKIAHVALGWQF